MMRKSLTILTMAVLFPLLAGAQSMSTGEWKMYKKILYKFESARYEGWKDEKVIKDVARRLGLKYSEAMRIFRNGQEQGKMLGDELQEKVKSLLDKIELKGTYHPITLKDKIDDIKVDTAHSHFVAYIKWRNEDKLDVEEEACLIAYAFAEEADIVDTLAMGAVGKDKKKNVFSAKIAIDAAKRIKKHRIVDFADKRFMKLFEDVKH